MKVLVTGGLGFIGSHTVVELIKAGHEAIIVDNLYNSSIEVLNKIEKLTNIRPKFYEVDILDSEKLDNVFKTNKIDAVIHFAGYKAVGESVLKPLMYYQNNIVGSLNLYNTMINNKVHKIVFSSSATVYGDPISVPINETFDLKTTNPYGTTKLQNEQILKDLSKAFEELSVVILRYFNPIGAHSSGLLGEQPNGIPNNLLPYIAQVADGTREFLSVYGDDYDTVDGTGVRDYIHVVDLAIAHIKALDYANSNLGYETFNVGTGVGYSVLEIVKAFEKASNKKINYKIVARRPGDIASCYADTKKANNILGFKTQYDINQMCIDAWNFQKSLIK